jgi:BMFP domain-containing protein YqiC
MTPELEQLKEQLAALIVDTAGSLHTQIQETERRLRTEMQQGFERLDARL